MPTVKLLEIMKDLGTNSVRELFRRTGSPETSVFKQAQIAAINLYFQKNGGIKGEFGFPLGKAEFLDNTGIQDFSGGRIKFLSDGPQGSQITVVRVLYVGFNCIQESDSDQLSGDDEPYFIIGVASASGSRTKRFDYEKVDTGTSRFQADLIVTTSDEITPPIVLGVIALEHDFGNKDEAEDKVRKAIEDSEKVLDKIANTFSGAPADNHVIPEPLRDILIGWIPEGIASLFGLEDDKVGSNSVVMFDNNADLLGWRAPAIIGKHGDNIFNQVVRIDGGGEGIYELFFLIDLFDKIENIKQREESRS